MCVCVCVVLAALMFRPSLQHRQIEEILRKKAELRENIEHSDDDSLEVPIFHCHIHTCIS